MKQPELSPYMMARKPSGIRLGQIKFLERKNPPILVNGSIGNVMRPMHPDIQRRYQLRALMNAVKHFYIFCAVKVLIRQVLMYS